MNPEKISAEVRQHLGNGVRLHDRNAFEAALGELKGQTVAVDPERRCRGHLRGARQGRREDHPGPRPDHPSEGDQERGRDCRPEVGAISRRRGDRPLPPLGRNRGAEGRRRRAEGLGPSGSAAPREPRASRPVVRQHFRRGSERGDRPLPVEREDQPQAREWHALSDRFRRPVSRRNDRHHAHRRDRRADAGDARPLHAGAEGPHRGRDRDLPEGHARDATRQLRSAAAVGSGSRLRARHRPRRRQLPVGPRRTAAHFAGRKRPGGRRRAAAGRA